MEAAGTSGIPVFPVQAYGFTPNFVDYPGSVTLRLSTYIALLTDLLDGIARSGFRRITIVNGHGGNGPAHGAVLEWLDRNRGCQVRWHNWWNAPETFAKVKETDPVAQPRVVDGEFPLDAACRRGHAQQPEADDGYGALCRPRSRREEDPAR